VKPIGDKIKYAIPNKSTQRDFKLRFIQVPDGSVAIDDSNDVRGILNNGSEIVILHHADGGELSRLQKARYHSEQ
jgi:hypothetical protein